MWFLICALAAVTLFTHDGYVSLSTYWVDSKRAAEEIYYVARGIEGLLLFGAVLYSAATEKRATPAQICALVALVVYGAAQETLSAVCGVAYMAMTGVGKHPNDRSAQLCDAATGWAWYIIALSVLLLIAFVLERRRAH